MRRLEAQIDEKSKNTEARQNVTGSYKKRVYTTKKYIYLSNAFLNSLSDISKYRYSE